ncbi:uncharacterized protein KD926_002447 [Aspergillus affinis]|uniref:uncharacterized protein n=1 Tax=Aspergillus affinis TaxID=1070780 RepID=UPI0022FDE99F|nr:uncharacterized protein KD926_002447 [Aspergillus affinis]KAI9036071.1 hypothetical protein KD926_002447 [Aspergillus affinis]
MRTAALLSALTAFLAVAVSGRPAQSSTGIEAPVEGYGVEDFAWEVETTPGGDTVILNGTVEEVYTELLKINPMYDGDFAAVAETNDAEKRDDSASLFKRKDVTCGKYPTAIRRRIEEGIAHLHRVKGKPRNGPGPGNCGRVSCSYRSAIWWCNDNTAPKTLPGFYNIAQGAQVVINQCNPTGVYVSGEENHADKWRALVRGSDC